MSYKVEIEEILRKTKKAKPPGPFEQLMQSVDKQKAKSWLEEREGVTIQSFRVNMRIDRVLRDFIEHGGFEV